MEIFVLYIVLHIPAIVLLFIGLYLFRKRPILAKVLLIIAAIYFIIGGGICYSLLSGHLIG